MKKPKVTQYNLSSITRELLQAVEMHDEEHCSELFEALSNYWSLYSTIEFIRMHDRKNAKWFFDTQKTAILREILQDTKLDGVVPKEYLTILDRAKVDWPELAILKKSLSAGKLNEDKNEEFLDKLKKVYSTQGIMGVLYAMDVARQKYKDWPQIHPLFDQDKDKVIKSLLRGIKQDDDLEWVNDVCISMKFVRVPWPELDIIRKSIGSPLEEDYGNEEDEYGEDDWDIGEYEVTNYEALISALHNNNVDDVGDRIYSLLNYDDQTVEEIVDNIAMNLDPIIGNKVDLVKMCLQLIKEENYEAAQVLVTALQKSKVNWPELKIIQNSLKADSKLEEGDMEVDGELWAELINAIKTHKQHDVNHFWGQLSVNWELPEMYEIVIANLTHGEVYPFLEKRKQYIIKLLLVYMKNHYFADAARLVNVIDSSNVGWPELDVIKKSLQASEDLTESKTVDFWAKAEEGLSGFDGGQIGDGLYYLCEFIRAKGNKNWAISLANKHKHKIIKTILEYIKVSATGIVQEDLINLAEIGVKWPELDVITKSLVADGEIKQ